MKPIVYYNGGGIDYNASTGEDRRSRRRNRRRAKSQGAIGDIDATGGSCGPEGCEATGPSRGAGLATRDEGRQRLDRQGRKASRSGYEGMLRRQRRSATGLGRAANELGDILSGRARRRRLANPNQYGSSIEQAGTVRQQRREAERLAREAARQREEERKALRREVRRAGKGKRRRGRTRASF